MPVDKSASVRLYGGKNGSIRKGKCKTCLLTNYLPNPPWIIDLNTGFTYQLPMKRYAQKVGKSENEDEFGKLIHHLHTSSGCGFG